ncbi:MAG: protein-L-isoaspartate(D-aspartate) O-methyltransferase [bacterium]|nr:protein-L-isoaspartate(D-aspartate) O-methyltransferase [bacterium]
MNLGLFSKKHKRDADMDHAAERKRMVDEQIIRRNVLDERVLTAMQTVPRHLFLPGRYRASAYEDGPLSIGHEQTISQPYIVASMTEQLEIGPDSRVLEIGTGCGYQTAVLAEIAGNVFSVEIVAELHQAAKARLHQLEYKNIHLQLGDGSMGWESESPFDGIIVTAAAKHVPENLLKQLGVGGTMVIPIGGQYDNQRLIKITRTQSGLVTETLYPVRFVPLVGDSFPPT